MGNNAMNFSGFTLRQKLPKARIAALNASFTIGLNENDADLLRKRSTDNDLSIPVKVMV